MHQELKKIYSYCLNIIFLRALLYFLVNCIMLTESVLQQKCKANDPIGESKDSSLMVASVRFTKRV